MDIEITDITPEQHRLRLLSPRQFFTYEGREVYMRVTLSKEINNRLKSKFNHGIPVLHVKTGQVYIYDKDSLVYKLRTNNVIHFHYQ